MPDLRTTEQTDTVTKISRRSASDTVARLTELIAAKGLRLFAVIDQAAEARKLGLQLRDTTLVIFGSPVTGTPVMVAALELPLKVLVWADKGETRVSYVAPDAIARRHGLTSELAANLAGINGLTDALIGP